MEDKNCELLFEYLRSILYDSTVKPLDLGALDEPYKKLGMGLEFLDHAVQEMKDYSEALSRGKLSAKVPDRDNFLCENLKNMHSNLNHLTWQAKQVAKGDYSQTVSYLGEFSEAFNTMTEQLREREKSLKLIAEQEKKHAEMAESYSQLLMELIARSEKEILVISLDGKSLLYSNRRTEEEVQNWDVYKQWISQIGQKKQQEDRRKERYEWKWEAEDSTHRFYAITTGKMKWQGEWAYVNIVQEVTDVGTMSIHVGANQDQVIRIDIPEVTTYTLGIDTVNVMTGLTASQSIEKVDKAINRASSVRSKIGSYQNRFEHTQNNIAVSNENLTSALSAMTDTDMAEEMTEYTSVNVMTQAATSILAQANERPSTVLQILQ